MAGTIGSLVGGTIAVILLGLLFGLAFKSQAPNPRALIAAFIALLVSGILAGFGTANGGPFRVDAIVTYIPGAVLAFFYIRWRYSKMWVDEEA